MSEFQRRFAAFNLPAENVERLKGLAFADFSFPKRAETVIVETVLIENGDRKVIKSEALGAKLV